MARKYQHIIELLPQIKEMLSEGMTQKEVEQALALTGYRPVHDLLRRERKKEEPGRSETPETQASNERLFVSLG